MRSHRRRVLTDLEGVDIIAAGDRSAPRGTLTLTAPVVSGEVVLRPILDAFVDGYPASDRLPSQQE